uniref:Ras and Rab interactor 2 n=1 Tax=Takifugu rubripes TaxID=31033 RepID=H2TAC4_TAKRU
MCKCCSCWKPPAEGRLTSLCVSARLESQGSSVHEQLPSCSGVGGERDSGYDSLKRRMSVFDRLSQTHPVWLLLSVSAEEATRILLTQPPGVFLVRKAAAVQKKVLSVRVEKVQSENAISHFPVRENQYSKCMYSIMHVCVCVDILPFTLKLPEAIASAKTQKELEEVAQLGAGYWNSALCSQRHCPRRPLSQTLSLQRSRGGDQGPLQAHSDSAPPILRSKTTGPVLHLERRHSSGPLCFLNPLFIQTHHCPHQHHCEPPFSLPPPRPPPPRLMPHRRPAPPPPLPTAATTRPKSMPAATMPAKPPQSSKRRPAPQPPKGPRYSDATKASNSPDPLPSYPPPPRPKKLDLEAQRCHIAMEDETIAEALSRAKLPSRRPPPADDVETNRDNLCAPQARGRQRLSDMSMSTSSSDSLDYSPSPDSSEYDENDDEDEEEDYGVGLETDLEMRLRQSSKSQRKRISVSLGGGSLILPKALKGRFQKVSGMLSSLVTPERRIIKKITELSQDRNSYFGSLVQDYIGFVQENRGCHTSGMDFLQTLRQFMTQMKAYLCQSSELDPPLESLIPEDQIDQVLEKAMHKSVLKPLKSVIQGILHDFQVNSGAWQQLKENLALAKTKRPQELGVDGAVLPDAASIDKIRQKFLNMRKMYSPEKKVSLLLRVCKLIYSVMQDNSGRMYGADDFLPMLTYVVAQCDVPQLDTEVEYMMELLDPSLLQGEGGYYLTSAYGAMALIKNFQEEQAARVLSSEARNTLHQWHRRRTAQRLAPSVNDFQNYLHVALQVDTGCTAKTLLVNPYTTTEEVCSLCAQKLKIQEPEQYALFLVTTETRQQLAPDTHPQRIKAELYSRPRTHTFHFLYRKVTDLNLCIPADGQNGVSSV